MNPCEINNKAKKPCIQPTTVVESHFYKLYTRFLKFDDFSETGTTRKIKKIEIYFHAKNSMNFSYFTMT